MNSLTANKEYSLEIISQIVSTNGNSRCFDCNKNNVSFGSLNNGIFLCDRCAELHKVLGKSVSELKSLFLDDFSEDEIKYFQLGGNKRLEELLSLYSLNKSQVSRIIFYNSNILDFHRKSIESEVNNSKCPIMPKTTECFWLSDQCDKALVNSLLKEENDSSLYYKMNNILSSFRSGTFNTFYSIRDQTKNLMMCLTGSKN